MTITVLLLVALNNFYNYQGKSNRVIVMREKAPTWVVKTTADLNCSQFTVKSHSPRGVGCNFASILLPTLTATIYKANTEVSTFEHRTESEV